MISYDDVRKNEELKAYIQTADTVTAEMGYSEHGFAHVGITAERAGYILETLGYGSRDVELVKIASYMHDVGNLVNRKWHALTGAAIAFNILRNMGFPPEEVATVTSAIGNHDEDSAYPVSPIAAALILADKGDVRRSRVRSRDKLKFDIHDRVNYAVEESKMEINSSKTEISLYLTVNTEICPLIDYFEIFTGRMILCRKTAEKLSLKFSLVINKQKMI